MQRFFAKYPRTSWRLTLLALAIPLAVVSAVFIWQDYQSRRDSITTQVRLQSAQVNSQLEAFVGRVKEASEEFAADWGIMYPSSAVDDAQTREQVDYLQKFASFRPHFSRAYITDNAGTIKVASEASLAGQQIGPVSLYERANSTKGFTVSDVVVPSGDIPPFALFVQPLDRGDGEPLDFLVLQSELDTISGALDMSNINFDHSGKTGIFDSRGRILAGTGYEEPHPGLMAGRDISGSAVWAQALTRPVNEWFGPGLDNVDRIIFFEYPKLTPWVTTVAYAQSELFDPLWGRLWSLGAALVATLAAILVVGDFVIRQERRNVTLLKNALVQLQSVEHTLRLSEARFRQLFDEAPIGYQEVDMTGRFTRVNETELAMLGYTPEELLGQPVWDFTTDRQQARQIIQSKLEESRSPGGAYELELLRKDGTTLPALIEDRLIRDEDGGVVGLRSTVHDITERKLVEERMQETARMASIGELAAGVAHEINNPLTSILGFAQLVLVSEAPEAPEAPEAIRSDLQIILSEAQRAARIVQNLLIFARKTEPKRELTDLNLVLERALELKTADFYSSGIRISRDLSIEPLSSMVDDHQLTQVFVNILTNAQQAIESSGKNGQISISSSSSNGVINVRITDNGPGIDPEVMERIFEPFFTTKPAGMGTGLGLSICYGIVKDHGGDLWVEDLGGEGVTFHLQIPVVLSENGEASSSIESLGYVSTRHILVVEDEPNIRELLQKSLEFERYTVDLAENGQEAWRKLRSMTYDCVVLDLKMPVMGGQELFQRINEVDESLAQKVLFITGDTIGRDTRDFITATGRLVLHKPFDIRELLGQVRTLTENSKN